MQATLRFQTGRSARSATSPTATSASRRRRSTSPAAGGARGSTTSSGPRSGPGGVKSSYAVAGGQDKGQRARARRSSSSAIRTGGPMPISLESLVATTRATHRRRREPAQRSSGAGMNARRPPGWAGMRAGCAGCRRPRWPGACVTRRSGRPGRDARSPRRRPAHRCRASRARAHVHRRRCRRHRAALVPASAPGRRARAADRLLTGSGTCSASSGPTW